jgi:hypothetical protein
MTPIPDPIPEPKTIPAKRSVSERPKPERGLSFF